MAGRLLYGLLGWTYEDLPDYWEKKLVVIGFPHTSNKDTAMAFAYIKIAKVKVSLLIKAEWFFWPMSVFLRSLGGVPVRRDRPEGFVGMIVEEFKKGDEFILAMVPEGTRKKITRIRTGFWNIARGANVPIVCWYLDGKAKRTRWLGKIIPGQSMEEDLQKIKKIYEEAGYNIPLG